MSKVIFLDIDGVLNRVFTPDKAPSGVIGVEDYLISHLYDIVKYTGAQIVLTSTWKRDWDKETGAKSKNYLYLEQKLAQFNLSIADKTNDEMYSRGYGIHRYIKDHPDITEWVVIDDDYFNDYDEVIQNHFVNTRFFGGALSNKKASQAIKILNGETNRTSQRRLDMKIFLITADYRNPPVTLPYAVQASTKKEAKDYFKNKYTWLKIYKVEEYIGDPNDIKWFW